MKKLICILLTACVLFVSSVTFASFSTYELTADTQILTKGGSLCSILIMTDGSNDARVILYDVSTGNDAAITNKLVEITVKGADNYGGRIWVDPVQFTEGLYADINGTGASFILEWTK
jgi:hypothetical protein